jgi:hypothetical protein
MSDFHGNPLASSNGEADRLLARLRSKGFRLGGVQAVFGRGESESQIRYLVNGVPLDCEQLRAVDEGRLKLAEPPSDPVRLRTHTPSGP